MKKWIVLALISSFTTVALHSYLSQRSYKLQAGTAGTSAVCNINETINCDAALLSPYAKVFNISVSNFGFSFYFFIGIILLLFLFFGMFQTPLWKRNLVYLSGLSLFVSLAFMAISLIESIYCPMCWGTYGLSLVTFLILLLAFRQDVFSSSFLDFIKESLKTKSLIKFFASVLFLSVFIHIFFMVQYDIKSNAKEFKILLVEWQQAKKYSFDVSAPLTKGPKQASMTIVEFADFTCPSCKRFAPQIKNFLNNHKDVRFEFYTYPLDGLCNPSVEFKSTGLACDLAKTLVCAAEQDKGWPMYNKIFDKQSEFLKNRGNTSKTSSMIKDLVKDTELNASSFDKCFESAKTHAYVVKQGQLGDKVKVRGTPTFFVNGRFVINIKNLSSFLNYIYLSQ